MQDGIIVMIGPSLSWMLVLWNLRFRKKLQDETFCAFLHWNVAEWEDRLIHMQQSSSSHV
jgi:hypothetical protein